MIESPENAFHYVTGGNVQAGGGFYIPR